MIRHAFRVAAVVSVLSLAPAAPARAQADSSATLASAPQQQISGSPFLAMWNYYNAEFERRASPSMTWGVSTSFLPVDDFRYRNAAVFWHYYPGGRAVHGFFVGGRLQYHRVAEKLTGASAGVGGVGFELGYNWILGVRQHFLIGTGVGATRFFGGALDGTVTLPTVRLLNVGVAF